MGLRLVAAWDFARADDGLDPFLECHIVHLFHHDNYLEHQPVGRREARDF